VGEKKEKEKKILMSLWISYHFGIHLILFLWSNLNIHHHYSSLQCHMIRQKSP